MNKFTEQNAITRRLDSLRIKWLEAVDIENTRIIRWLCQPDELRMIDAFCLIEASEYGQLDDLFMRFSANLDKAAHYDYILLNEWLSTWNNEEARKQLVQSGIKVNWNSTPWEKALEQQQSVSFLACINEFVKCIEGFKHHVVIYIKPVECANEKEWIQWINQQAANGIPDRLRVMISDISGYELFKKSDKQPIRITIPANLNMAEAVKEIATSGDPNSPEVQFNTCLFKMNEAVAGKNYQAVDEWGQKAIEAGRKSGHKSLEVTGSLSYGATLMQIKKLAPALNQFTFSRNVAQQGMEDGDENCKSLFLFSHTFEAAVHMQSRNYKKAYPIYAEAAGLAGKMQNYLMAVDSSYMAAYAAKKEGKSALMLQYLKEGIEYVKQLDTETAKYSSCLLIGKELVDHAKQTYNKQLEEETHDVLKNLWGEKWLDAANYSEKVKKENSGLLGMNFFKNKN